MTPTKMAPTALVALRRALGAQALAMASCLAMPALAQTLTVYEEQGQLVRGSRNITAIGHDALGDRINPYTGSLEFVQTDFALPGNHSLPVGVGRRLKTGNTFWQGAHFADWELEIPHLKGTFSNAEGWTVDQWGANRTKRCSLFSEPGEAPTQTLGARVLAESFWKGNFLVVPGAGEQEMLLRAGTTHPTSYLRILMKTALRPARSIGQTRAENAAARRAAKGLPPKPEPSSKWKKCDECRVPISPTEHNYNGGLCSACCIGN